MLGIGNTGVCLRPRRFPRPGKPGARLVNGGLDDFFGIDLLPQRSLWLCHCLLPWRLLELAASCVVLPLAPVTSCAAIRLRQPRHQLR
uniref:Uncharacterized protein n=1 Tax=Arundo donax TaxID=35708 RepID=A0A0A8Y7V6_ARUDO